jgi:putative phage-type endonuclease
VPTLYHRKKNMDPRVERLCDWQLRHGTTQKTDEWHEARRRCITASSLSSVVNENPYRGAAQVLLEKLGLSKQFEGSEATRHGEQYEDEAIRRYTEETGASVHHFGLLFDQDLPGLAGSPDGITADGILLEVKVRLT